MRILVSIIAVCLCLQGQPSQNEARGIPPRTAAADYQANAQAGTVSLGAEFLGHSIPTPQGALVSDEYVVVETGLFGATGASLKLTVDDFSLRINGKKPSPSQPYGMVIGSVKDPDWEPPTPPASKSKTSMGGGGNSDKPNSNDPPAPVKIPIEVQRAMAQRIQKASLPVGDRPLPQAGLLFFQHRGKTDGIKSIELMYDGPAGKATLKLQP